MKENFDQKNPAMANFLDNLSMNLHGRYRSVAIAGQSCVSCGGRADKFRDALSEKEFGISGLCQKCQDSVFGG